METTQEIALPPGYRVADVIAFHGRDAEGLAEQVGPDGLRKGVLLDGVPTLLDIRFDGNAARCRNSRSSTSPSSSHHCSSRSKNCNSTYTCPTSWDNCRYITSCCSGRTG